MGVVITPKVQKDVAEIIRKHYAAFAAILYGPGAVSKEDWDAAIKLGLVDPKNPKGQLTGLASYGALLAHLEQAERQERYGTSLASFKAEVAKNPVPQTVAEHYAAEHMEQRGAQRIVGLGNKVGAEVGSKLIEADKKLDAKLRGAIRDVISARFGDGEAGERVKNTAAGLGAGEEYFRDQFRSTIREQVSDLGHSTKDWSRDLQRIVQTETHDAVSEAQGESWSSQEAEAAETDERSPRRVLVFKLPRPDCCGHCDEFYLSGGVPRLYYLDELQANGTNAGRKTAMWLPVVGTTHPWCACTLHRVPFLLIDQLPEGWVSGDPAPKVIGPGGSIA